MFIGAKMLADPWVHISTGLSLAIVGGIIVLAILISVIRAKPQAHTIVPPQKEARVSIRQVPAPTPEYIHRLADPDRSRRAQVAQDLYSQGQIRTLNWSTEWSKDEELRALLVREKAESIGPMVSTVARLTVGIAVLPETFDKIRAANGSPPLADAPTDQDVLEFELEFSDSGMSYVHLDILTTKAPGGNGAIARFLEKFGEGIQQVEFDVTDVDRATEILRTRFKIEPIYPAARPGADGTRVNFFLVTSRNNQKVLVELVEQPKGALK
jgi:hypothetical protein